MGSSSDVADEDTIGTEYHPVLTPRQKLEELRSKIPGLIGEVAVNGAASGAISRHIEQKLYDIIIGL